MMLLLEIENTVNLITKKSIYCELSYRRKY